MQSASNSAHATHARFASTPAQGALLGLLLPSLLLACTPDEGVGSATDASATSEASADDASSTADDTPGSSGEPDETTTSGGQALSCVPDHSICADDGVTLLVCRGDGTGIDAVPCADDEVCEAGECLGPCDRIEGSASNEGCSFTTTAGLGGVRISDGLTVTNPGDAPAIVELLHTPRGTHKESPTDALVVLPPGTSHTYKIFEDPSQSYSYVYSGGSYRLTSDRPVVVAQHSPIAGESTIHESALLLPDHSLGLDYVIAASPAATEPSYFTVVATADKTRITWTPPVASAGSGLPIPFVAAGETGELVLNRGDTLRIGASAKAAADPALRDLSGTLVHADRPIAVFAGAVCGEIPFGVGPCNNLFEAMIPVAYWGREYVGAAPPAAAEGPNIWRIYAGADDLTVTLDPPEAGGPLHLDARGDWVELTLESGVGVVFRGDAPFMPVRHLAGPGGLDVDDEDATTGGPALAQMVPVEQYRPRYAFQSSGDALQRVVQVTRPAGGDPVLIDGEAVVGFVPLGDYEVATVSVAAGSHIASSEAPFGLISYGDDAASSHAHPAGLGLNTLP